MNNYEIIVGLEIHVELSTHTKMFCRCEVSKLSDKPNTKTCPVCLGLPGALPFPNKKAIENCIKIGLALNCKINKDSYFDRKNYFYPDLAKGFQTSQYLHPFGEKGYLDINVNGQTKRVGITRVHMEEDTGKLTHATVDGKEVSLIDFNRSGVPLVEIVTEPDIRSGEEAKVFLTELQKIIRYLGVSDADMEKGHMRLEPNISLRKEGETKLANYKVEVKNINSFKFVDKAIQFEEKRQKEVLESGETPLQETRGWNEFKNKTVSQRVKGEAHDYRYFPEPDIPPIHFGEQEISKLKSGIPELPKEKTKRFVKDFGLSNYSAEILTRGKSMADFFEQSKKIGEKYSLSPKKIADFIINKKINVKSTLPADVIKEIKEAENVKQVDEKELEQTILEILEKNKAQAADYKKGKTQLTGFFIGQVKKSLPEAKDIQQISQILTKLLNS
jgi:aspartyl-tRNA(Asn)/glutamyl-tRNA(Gln) amidotransferase subunit B